jgi:hypothetical protein
MYEYETVISAPGIGAREGGALRAALVEIAEGALVPGEEVCSERLGDDSFLLRISTDEELGDVAMETLGDVLAAAVRDAAPGARTAVAPFRASGGGFRP